MQEELVGELTTKATSVTIKEMGPGGIRVSQNSQGRIQGLYDASHLDTMEGVLKPDGSMELEFQAMQMTTEGDLILVRGRGTTKMVSPTTSRIEGTGTFQTASKKFGWLNAAKGRLEGTVNPATSEAKVKVFAQR